MEYLRLDPDIDTDPELEEAGWWAARVYELLLKVSGKYDLRGRLPPQYRSAPWLARRWNLTAAAIPNVNAEVIILGAISALKKVGKVREEDGALVIAGWEKFYNPRKSSTARVRAFRESRKRDETDETQAPFHETHETQADVSRNASVSRNGETLLTHSPTHVTHPPTAGASLPAGDQGAEFFGRCQDKRHRLHGDEEVRRPAEFDGWFPGALAYAGGDVGLLDRAYGLFLKDDYWRGERHPFKGFIGGQKKPDRWKDWVEKARARQPEMKFTDVANEDPYAKERSHG